MIERPTLGVNKLFAPIIRDSTNYQDDEKSNEYLRQLESRSKWNRTQYKKKKRTEAPSNSYRSSDAWPIKLAMLRNQWQMSLTVKTEM